jgi:hypothetical protein
MPANRPRRQQLLRWSAGEASLRGSRDSRVRPPLTTTMVARRSDRWRSQCFLPVEDSRRSSSGWLLHRRSLLHSATCRIIDVCARPTGGRPAGRWPQRVRSSSARW